MCCRQLVVVAAVDIFHVQELEDVVHTGDKLHVGLVRVHDVAALGELHEHRRVGVLFQIRIVFVGELTPESFHTELRSQLASRLA